MTPIQFDTGVKKILLVEVPEGTTGIVINETDGVKRLLCCAKGLLVKIFILPPGPWQSLGIASEISEQVADNLVKYKIFYGGPVRGTDVVVDDDVDFYNYIEQMFTCCTAIQSLLSICTLHNMLFDRTVILI